jgi:[acyl-carrier-protein] S-malonyltransferase
MHGFIFPGQGSQKVGMGRELAAASPAARDVFAEVDEALSQNLFRLMTEGPDDDLTLTENAQPAIMAHSLAVLRVLGQEFGVAVTGAGALAGHSLGEYPALCAAGAFSLADTARLLKTRGRAMQEAVPVGKGAMAALLGADLDVAKSLAKAAAGGGFICEIANDNDPTQTVISGHAEAIDKALGLAKEYGVKRGVRLPVSAPFHCSLMEPAARQMEEALVRTPPKRLQIAVYANVTAAAAKNEEVASLLVRQVTETVRWRESVLAMRADGIEHFVELGGKVLTPMVARIDGAARSTSLMDIGQIEAFAKEFA